MVGTLFFGLLAAIFWSVGVIILVVQNLRRHNAIAVSAQVLRYSRQPMQRSSSKGYVAIYQATLPDGRVVQMEGNENWTEKRWPEGSMVELLHCPDNESQPMIEKANRVVPIVFCVIGALASLAAIAVYHAEFP